MKIEELSLERLHEIIDKDPLAVKSLILEMPTKGKDGKIEYVKFEIEYPFDPENQMVTIESTASNSYPTHFTARTCCLNIDEERLKNV